MFKLKLIGLCSVLPFLLTGCADVEKTSNTPRSSNQHEVSTSHNQQIKDMIKEMIGDNDKFMKTHEKSYFEPFIDHQTPRATVVACSDSRFHTHAIDQTPDNDIFFVRNIGNQLATGEGSIQYGVEHLKTPLLMFIGHTACGAVKAASSDYSALETPIQLELDHLQLVKKEKPTEAELKDNVILNVHNQVAKAMIKFKERVQSGSVKIVGAVYDFQNKFGQGYGKLVIINVNNMKDEKEINSFKNVILK
ncbi:MAG: carbonic anhydrase [Pseudomonadota bacterium]